MENKHTFTKVLAIAGTVLMWFTLLAPVLLAIAFLIHSGEFHFDYLMPAELFLVAFGGWLLLLWAALRARRQLRLIGWGFGVAFASLFGGQGLAIITGLASGETELGGWQWVLVLGMIMIYILALVAIAVGGALLVRDLFRKPAPETG